MWHFRKRLADSCIFSRSTGSKGNGEEADHDDIFININPGILSI